MAVLIGQVYYPRFNTKVVDGETKTNFAFSLATRKAFIDDKEKPNLFTSCITYQAGLAKALSDHFGQTEDKGKAIVVYGHYNEYDWNPDPANADHDKFWQSFTITNDYLTAGGIKLAEGSATQMVVQIPVKQTTRQFVVTGFEFADSASSSRPRATAVVATDAVPVRIGAPAGAQTAVGSAVPATDGNPPF
jgi:hypothetical protein